MKKIAVIPNPLKDTGYIETRKIIEYISSFNCDVFIESIHKESLKPAISDRVKFAARRELFSESELIIALGGDGTIIEAAVEAAEYSVPIVGINMGTLGFLTQIETENYAALKDIIDGKFSVNECTMLDIDIVSESGEIVKSCRALNDLIISGSSHKMINTSTFINGTCMGRYSADGIIVSTAIGSTAYSLSAGGAIMHPEVDAMIITPICPHTLKARSTVIPGSSTVEIIQTPPYRTKAVVNADGNVIYEISDSKEIIRIKKSEYTTLLVKLENTNFFDILRNKLSD